MAALDEQRFKALGKDWVARFDFNSVCEIEERTGEPFMAIAAPFLSLLDEADADNEQSQIRAASQLRMADLRLIFQQSLQPVQPNTSLEEAGQIIAEIGLNDVIGVVAWAIAKAMPVKGGDAEGDANPPKPGNRRKKAAKAG